MKYIRRRRFRKVVEAAQLQAEAEKRLQDQLDRDNQPIIKALKFVEREGTVGRVFNVFIAWLIIANVVAVLIESMEEVHDYIGQHVFDIFEFVSVCIFTVEYLLRLWTAKVNKKYGGKRWEYFTSFLGMVDLITVVPYWCELALSMWFGIYINSFIFRLFRIFRILQLENFVSAFTLLDDVWFSAKDSLISTLFLAILVWVVGSCLFYEFEKDNPRMDGAFSSLPASMYYAGIFLGGEWGLIDFTPMGQLVCIFYCVCGIAVFSLPVGSVFEAFGDVLSDKAEEGDDDDEDGGD